MRELGPSSLLDNLIGVLGLVGVVVQRAELWQLARKLHVLLVGLNFFLVNNEVLIVKVIHCSLHSVLNGVDE